MLRTARPALPAAQYLLRLYQPMCDERMGNRLARPLARDRRGVRETIFGAKMSEADKNAATLAAECLQKTGELREELLPVLWEPLGLRRDEYADVALTLSHQGCILLTENTRHGRRWAMPSRLEGYHAEVEEGWLEATQRPSEVLRVAIALGHSAPPGCSRGRCRLARDWDASSVCGRPGRTWWRTRSRT